MSTQIITPAPPKLVKELTYEELLQEQTELIHVSIPGESNGARALRVALDIRLEEVNRGVALFQRLTLGNLTSINSEFR